MKKIDIFISEQETLEDALKSINTKVAGLSDKQENIIRKEFDKAFGKAFNNRVGYYVTYNKVENYYIKLYILPKTIKKPTNSKESQHRAIKELLKYIFHYYRLQAKYKEYNQKEKYFGYQDIAFDVFLKIQSAQSTEEFIFYKYQSLLQRIKKFFVKHQSYQRKKTEYSSQSIKHKVDLAKNIKELNKANIHQIKYVDVIYSDIATATYGILKLFFNKIMLLEADNKQEILYLTQSIQHLLLKKYNINDKVSVNEKRLVSNSLYKYFRKKIEHKKLYSTLLALFGFENFFDEDDKDVLFDIHTDLVFIDPSLMYEWYIYDVIKQQAACAQDEYDIKFDQKESKKEAIKESYFYTSKHGKQKDITSNPDILIYSNNENKVYIIDVKWKVKEPALEDILKLKRDCEVRSQKYSVYAILIYPRTEENNFSEHLYNNEVITFNFSAKEISLNNQDNEDSLEIFLRDVEEALPDTKLDKQIQQSCNLLKNTMQSLQSYEFEDKVFEDSFIMDQTLQQNLVLHDEITKIYTLEEILTDPLCTSLENFLTNHNGILEKECIDFIHSSASSMFYFEKHPNNHYDYSLPASGLWKAIEVELNASIIFLLRYQSGVCTKEYYWKQKGRVNDYIQTGPKKKVFLTDSKKDRHRLDNILLGSFPHIMKNIKQKNYDNDKTLESFQSIYSEYIYHYHTEQSLEKWAERVTNFLFDLVKVRNPYTHKDLMHKVTYDTYLDYVMNNPLFNFHDLMRLKKDIHNYIKSKDLSSD